MKAKMKIRKGDHVIVVAGRDKGRTGEVIAVYPDRGKVMVQGVNVATKNKKVTYQQSGTGSSGSKRGGITHEEARRARVLGHLLGQFEEPPQHDARRREVVEQERRTGPPDRRFEQLGPASDRRAPQGRENEEPVRGPPAAKEALSGQEVELLPRLRFDLVRLGHEVRRGR